MSSDATHAALPSSEVLKKTYALDVFDEAGKAVSFGSLVQDQETIVQYVAQLASVRKDALSAASTRLVVVGCGEWKLIKNYCETTGFSYSMYADPSRELYHAFGLVESLDRTPAGQEKRSYISGSFLGNVVKSIWEGPLKNPQFMGKQGNISQLGGDFIFGPGETCTYASRMKHTEDHVEVADLMKEAGVAYP
ncbi:AhpC/TSA antioxidant enzyme-domain-containing protein [Trametes maxima]|nr:AhpC/TSA antioxidant enzyme-domain-containing protein [Trametes maxima]